jgi:hypothetical protein
MTLTVPAVTGWSGFWGVAPNSYAMMYSRSSIERNISRWLARGGARRLHTTMSSLNGNAVGGAMGRQYARVSAPNGLTSPQLLGGARAIDTVVVVPNSNTTAADKVYVQDQVLDAILEQAPGVVSTGGVGNMPVTVSSNSQMYPVDPSGNGGGGKLP